MKMEDNGYGQGKMSVCISGNLDPLKTIGLLGGMAKPNGLLISLVGFVQLDKEGRFWEATGPVTELRKIKRIVMGTNFLEDRLYLGKTSKAEAIHYLTFAADYLSNRTRSLGFCQSKFPGVLRISWGVVSLENVMSVFREISFDFQKVIVLDKKTKRISLVGGYIDDIGVPVRDDSTFVSAPNNTGENSYLPIFQEV